jgi:hypothetical protein
MLEMSRNILAFLIILSAGSLAWSTPADDLNEILSRAQALYYEADFAKSIELLLRADELLQQQSSHVQEKTEIKLQLALGFIGLNDTVRAKEYLRQLYALDPDHQIDPQTFSPKVIQLAEEARAEQNELRCRSLKDEAQQQLGAGNADAAVNLIASNIGKCSGLAPLNSKAAELFFKAGLEAYKKAQMETARQKFQAALRADPKDELANEYLELAESKLEVAADRVFLAWRKDFNKGDFALAAHDYHELISRGSSDTIDEVRMEYRRTLSTLVESWNGACANDDEAAMEEVRLRVNELLPDWSFAEDILAKMKTCTHTGCLKMSSSLALARLKRRVNPEFPASVLSQVNGSPVTVHVKARINENGDVENSQLYGGPSVLYFAVQSAFVRWKFTPAMTGTEARCVDTDIPIIINLSK